MKPESIIIKIFLWSKYHFVCCHKACLHLLETAKPHKAYFAKGKHIMIIKSFIIISGQH